MEPNNEQPSAPLTAAMQRQAKRLALIKEVSAAAAEIWEIFRSMPPANDPRNKRIFQPVNRTKDKKRRRKTGFIRMVMRSASAAATMMAIQAQPIRKDDAKPGGIAIVGGPWAGRQVPDIHYFRNHYENTPPVIVIEDPKPLVFGGPVRDREFRSMEEVSLESLRRLMEPQTFQAKVIDPNSFIRLSVSLPPELSEPDPPASEMPENKYPGLDYSYLDQAESRINRQP